jgi:hypothetical protein
VHELLPATTEYIWHPTVPARPDLHSRTPRHGLGGAHRCGALKDAVGSNGEGGARRGAQHIFSGAVQLLQG